MPRSQFLLELVGPMCSQAEGDLLSLEEEEPEKGRKEEGGREERGDWEIMKIRFSQDVPVCTGMAFSLPLWINCSPSRKNEQVLYLKSHLTFMTKINGVLGPKLACWMLFFQPQGEDHSSGISSGYLERRVWRWRKWKSCFPSTENNDYSCPLGLILLVANSSSWFSDVCTSHEPFEVTMAGLLWSISLLFVGRSQFLFFFFFPLQGIAKDSSALSPDLLSVARELSLHRTDKALSMLSLWVKALPGRVSRIQSDGGTKPGRP